MPKRSRLRRGSSKARPIRLKVVSGVNMSVSDIESLARKVMLTDAKIWDKHGWESGGAVDFDVYKRELKMELDKMGVKSLHGMFYSIFEDANWHTMNRALEELGIMQQNDQEDKVYNAYRKRGGKTWELT